MNNSDNIKIKNMVFYGYHGVNSAENKLGQNFTVDVELFRCLLDAGITDDINKTTDYTKVFVTVQKIVEGPCQKLIESIASKIADTLLEDKAINAIKVIVHKPNAPIKGSINTDVAVEIYRINP